ncbi:hypothetical protein [Haliscomenobacter hydrossis]|uniref:Uncharacterized protein n=1 Tax=Haliscomenobacter hydrossis (strain ATCC 27775 / DSM 1100 / LMG 10767 / O) TaxID=760192 RepID=F4KVQ3_HALH1|nr:hypothetical protein [Haliscomenobacter hydrossis]AEE52510.1 hypothetical protein Halhy_4675 [Haliscomenobacter hydrossis DSM 1100]
MAQFTHIFRMFSWCFFLSPALMFAQYEDLSEDMPFFQQKAQEYQNWLENKSLSEALQVDHVQFKTFKDTGKKDYTELELILVLRTHDLDSAVGKWNSLKKSFDSPADSLEAFLYRSFIHKMEINPAKGNIQIYIQDADRQYIPCFYIWIWWKNGRIVSQKQIQACKTKSFEVLIPAYRVSNVGRGQTAKVAQSQIKSPQRVFNLISSYIKSNLLQAPRYQDILNDRKPIIEDSLREGNHYTFIVANLGKEVLSDQTRSFWEKWVGINTIAMERLCFQFDYSPNPDGSFNLKCTIDGKYGSGIFKPRKSAYMNMDDDFDDFFELYKNKFRQALLKQLTMQP